QIDLGNHMGEETQEQAGPDALLLAREKSAFQFIQLIFGDGENHLVDDAPPQKSGELSQRVDRIGAAKSGLVDLRFESKPGAGRVKRRVCLDDGKACQLVSASFFRFGRPRD